MSKLPKVLHWAHQLCFSADSSQLFAASASSSVHVVSLSANSCKHKHTFKPKTGSTQPIHLLSVSADGQWLATANSDREVHVYSLTTLKRHCTVPVYRSGVSAMAIHPTTSNLFMAHADQQVFEFSIEQKQYTDWSRTVQRDGLHFKWLQRDTPVTSVTFNPRNPAHIILHDMYMFCVIDQSLPLPHRKDQFFNQLTLKSLPEQDRQEHCHAFKVCKLFQPLMCVDMMEDHSLVVVERSLLDIAAKLPAPVRQKKFAT